MAYVDQVRDGEIREALLNKLGASPSEAQDTLVRSEFGLCLGEARVDVIVVNGSLTGYEIKSARDRLDRLQRQASFYDLVLDNAVLVSPERHLSRAAGVLAEWWGLWLAEKQSDSIRLSELRAPRPNPCQDPYRIAQLLWRDEAYSLLQARGLHKGLASATRFRLWDTLADKIDISDLKHAAVTSIKARQVARVGD